MQRSLVLVFAACGSTGGPGPMEPGEEPDAPVESAVRFERCVGRAYTLAPDEGWRHTIASPIVTAAGASNHSGADLVVNPGVTPVIPGKFTYGLISKDLEDEDVLVSIDDCTGWKALGRRATDSDGRMSIAAPSDLSVGVHEVRFQVAGDQTVGVTYVWVLPRGTHIALTDIDATLTTNDSELFRQILDGSYIPATYPNAVALTTAHAAKGHIVMYMTGRPYWLSGKTREYLGSHAFAPGPTRLADSNSDILPTEASVGAYKRRKITDLLDAGLIVDLAYGNATTDISAYLGAGLPPDRVWVIGPHAGEQGTHPVMDDWATRVAEVDALPPVVQPFEQ